MQPSVALRLGSPRISRRFIRATWPGYVERHPQTVLAPFCLDRFGLASRAAAQTWSGAAAPAALKFAL
jgi:hypothetical protein